jgi:hypothetical protein
VQNIENFDLRASYAVEDNVPAFDNAPVSGFDFRPFPAEVGIFGQCIKTFKELCQVFFS